MEDSAEGGSGPEEGGSRRGGLQLGLSNYGGEGGDEGRAAHELARGCKGNVAAVCYEKPGTTVASCDCELFGTRAKFQTKRYLWDHVSNASFGETRQGALEAVRRCVAVKGRLLPIQRT